MDCFYMITASVMKGLNSINNILGSITWWSYFGYNIAIWESNYSQAENSYIINVTIKYLVDSKRFGVLLLSSVVIYELNALNVFMITCF